MTPPHQCGLFLYLPRNTDLSHAYQHTAGQLCSVWPHSGAPHLYSFGPTTARETEQTWPSAAHLDPAKPRWEAIKKGMWLEHPRGLLFLYIFPFCSVTPRGNFCTLNIPTSLLCSSVASTPCLVIGGNSDSPTM